MTSSIYILQRILGRFLESVHFPFMFWGSLFGFNGPHQTISSIYQLIQRRIKFDVTS